MEGSLLAAANVILRLVKSHYESIKYNISDKQKPIIVPITRKGYWLFCMISDERDEFPEGNILNEYQIYSDRYLTKMLDGEEFSGKEVLLFDDTFETGHHMFLCYTMLTKWGANVTPIAYKCSISGRNGIDLSDEVGQKLKWKQYIDLVIRIDEWNYINNRISLKEKSVETYKKEIEEQIHDFNHKFCKTKERYFLNEKERALFNINELEIFEKKPIPLIIDLPIIKDKKNKERFVRMTKEKWSQFISAENNEWKFEENIVEETLGLHVSGSFLCAPQRVQDKLPERMVLNSIIKCKYVLDDENVRVTFVPFVLMKSMPYLDLAICFIRLFKGTVYYDDILKCVNKYGAIEEESLVESFNCAIRKHFNLYRTVYRAVVWYLSSYIGKEFIFYAKEVDSDIAWDYDWEIMSQNIPENLKTVLQELDIQDVYKSLEALRKLSDSKETQNVIREVIKDRVDSHDIYDYMKFKIADSKFSVDDTREILSIEEMENLLEKNCSLLKKTDRRRFLTKIISLFQEGSCFSNALYNDSSTNVVCRGFLAGENSIILLGMTMVTVFPYIFALYTKKGKTGFITCYEEFVDWLTAYFNSKEYFDNKITRKGFEYCINYFRTKREDVLTKKISGNIFLVEKNPQMYRDIYFMVDKWKV